jgi:hypothetical protein
MTVGYGDITPITNFSRILTVFEAFLGVVCLGMFSASFFAYVVNVFSHPWKLLGSYMNELQSWTKSTNELGEEVIYYIPNPDFSIVPSNTSDTFSEPWSDDFPDPNATKSTFNVKYKNTVLYNFIFVFCDGGRGVSVLPDQKVEYDSPGQHKMSRYFYLIKGSFKYKLNRLVQHHYHSELIFQINVFYSQEEAEKKIPVSFKNGLPKLTHFRWDGTGTHKLVNPK